ncbi:MAG: hypothetical protein JNK14_07580 [Chitinophagaceae bacterium]|nr:hypothetical protein [Chitinophagaceae bacterium]
MTTAKILLLIFVLHTGTLTFSQSTIDSLFGKLDPQKWTAAIEKKSDQLAEKIIAKSEKTLSRLQRQEEKLYKRMLKTKDSLQAKASLEEARTKYQALRNNLRNPAIANSAGQYIPKIDTLSTALKFLDQHGMTGNIKNVLAKTELLKDKFQQAEEIKRFIRERKQQLNEQLNQLGLTRQLKHFNKELYYYSQQINEYKELLKDSKKAERKALELLSKTNLFKDFMRKNSMLASLFRIPSDPNDPAAQANLAGLQTRAQVNNLIQQQIAAGGPSAQAQFRQNIQEAQGKLNELKDKVLKHGGGSSDAEMPEGFKPNNQKTKNFWQRLEYGTNVQTQKATNFFPVTSDIGLSIGYKLNDKSIIGVGASYKMGLGTGWNNLQLTNQGVGLRSFIDWKIKGSFWISGGYEQNFRTAFSDFDQLRNFSSWQTSGLIGLSKVVSLKTKFFKKTKVQLLWDFLSYEQVPRTQPVVFRIGYNF